MKNLRLLIGHRGVGKTSLLKRLADDFPDHLFFDLDQEISSRFKKTIDQIFLEESESGFRAKEMQTFLEFFGKQVSGDVPVWISLGAGFPLDALSAVVRADCTLIWVARRTDAEGRIFLDRPRLNGAVSPIVEYLERYRAREESFNRHYDLKYDMLEGIHVAAEFSSVHIFQTEKKIFQGTFQIGNYGFTLQALDLQSQQRWNAIQREMQARNFKFIELRNDILSEAQILECFSKIPVDQILFSFRHSQNLISVIQRMEETGKKFFGIDFDQKLTSALTPYLSQLKSLCQNMIVSSHSQRAPWDDFKKDLDTDVHWKWSPLVKDFAELQLQLDQFGDRSVSYLPRSATGRWSWLRLQRSHDNKINFVNRGQPSAPDQPSLFEALASSNTGGKFAAVLGNPVFHSYSPAIHFDFFFQRKMSFHRIEVSEAEWSDALPMTTKLGLSAAAVTAPLKIKAFESSSSSQGLALEFESVNTLIVKDSGNFGFNTDAIGFSRFAGAVADDNVMVWGGGGTKKMLSTQLPGAEMISARNPVITEQQMKKKWILIWAAARSADTKFPPAELEIQKIVDLNYSENSMGRELAQLRGVNYVSGLKMLIEQAREQQKLWQEIK